MFADAAPSSCLWQLLAIVGSLLVFLFVRYYPQIRDGLRGILDTTAEAARQWVAILAGVIGANMGYFVLWIGEEILNSRTGKLGTGWDLSGILLVSYLIGIPALLVTGVLVGLLTRRYGERHGFSPIREIATTLLLSTAGGFLCAFPLQCLGLLGAAV